MADIQDTGERYLPVIHDADMSCEHWHRYLYATQFARDATVLDLACGEGYGSYLLADKARKVVGMDISEQTIRQASAKYARPNLQFKAGGAENIPIKESALFDLIVSFETLEHLTEEGQHAFLREIVRLLKTGGTLIISTPNKALYSDRCGYRNQFHLKEFYVDEFRRFLGRYFGELKLLGQRVYRASYIWDQDGDGDKKPTEYCLQSSPAGFHPSDEAKEMRYTIAVCSGSRLEAPNPSLLLDLSGTNGAHEERWSLDWEQDRRRGSQDIMALIPPGKSFILVDEDQWAMHTWAGERHSIPFLEHEGAYWGAPADDDTAIREVERLRRAGAAFLVVARPAFWWLDYYADWQRYLQTTFRCLLANERVCVFDLLQTPEPEPAGKEPGALKTERRRHEQTDRSYPPGDLRASERRVFSEDGEDGILEELLRRVGRDTRYFVEFGVGSGRYCNCARLVFEEDWRGLFMEAAPESFRRLQQRYLDRPKTQCVHALVTSANIETLLTTYDVPREFDVLSIDIDGNDYWVWAAIKGWRPRIVVIEYNASFAPPRKWVMQKDPERHWDGTNCVGASLASLASLGKEKGYVLVATNSERVNAFFVRNDLFTDESFLDPAVYYYHFLP